MATSTAPSQWWDEDDEVLATALDVLGKRAEEVKRSRGKRR
jgi:hypothetical protein